VLGTDVSEKALEAARRGCYGPWSLRGVPVPDRARWLRAEGERWSVLPEVRALAEFRRHNLITEAPPADGFDAVLCRNVLIYFDPPTARAVVERLFGAVRPGGLLALAPAESFFAEPLGFEEVEGSGGVLWRNVRRAAPASRARAPAGRAAPPRSATPRPAPSPAPAAQPPAAPLTAPQPAPTPAPVRDAAADGLDEARRAAAEGRWAEAEQHASSAGETRLLPEPFLYAAAAAEARGDAEAALRWIGRALFLDPGHAVARASLVPLLERLGQREAAARARRQALDALARIPDDQLLPGVEPVAAGALRDALSASHRLEVSR
jgi:chemotaxis protein methyltransferase CheR